MRDVLAGSSYSEESRRYMPLFMVIAGQSGSGKTHLLKFLSHSCGNHGQYYHFDKKALLDSSDKINPRAIYSLLDTENPFPVWVDEISRDYFSSENSATSTYMGESFIKNITNSKRGIVPCVVATCNTDFAVNNQVSYRIYYIQLNNPFDKAKNREATEYFNNIVLEFGSELHRDFLFRLRQRIGEGMEIDSTDFLKVGRSIFMEYFKIAGMEVPFWFCETRIDDYFLRGKMMWRDLFKMKRKGFKKDGSSILLDSNYVFGEAIGAGKDKRESLQYLPSGVLVEDKAIVRLNRKEFFRFIDEPVPISWRLGI